MPAGTVYLAQRSPKCRLRAHFGWKMGRYCRWRQLRIARGSAAVSHSRKDYGQNCRSVNMAGTRGAAIRNSRSSWPGGPGRLVKGEGEKSAGLRRPMASKRRGNETIHGRRPDAGAARNQPSTPSNLNSTSSKLLVPCVRAASLQCLHARTDHTACSHSRRHSTAGPLLFWSWVAPLVSAPSCRAT